MGNVNGDYKIKVNIPPETWEERLDGFLQGYGIPTTAKFFKDFIRAEIKKKGEQAQSSAYERVVEVLEGMKREDANLADGRGERDNWFFNLALSEAISKIEELQGKI